MTSPPQQSFGDVAQSFLRSGSRLAALAAACALLAAALPVVNISSSVFGMNTSVGASGADLAGVFAWLVVLGFAGAAAARFVPAVAPYRNLLDWAAFGVLAAAVLYAFFGGPIAAGLNQVSRMQSGLGGLMGAPPGGRGAPPVPQVVSVSVLPHVGALFLLAAPVALFLARRQEAVLPR